MGHAGKKYKFWGKRAWFKSHLVFSLIFLSSCTNANVANLVLPSSPQSIEEKEQNKPPPTRWDVYYSNIEHAPAEIRVMQPLGTTRPMGKLIATSVAEQLERVGVKSSTEPLGADDSLSQKNGANQVGASEQNIYVLSGNAEIIENDPRVRYAVIIRWVLSDKTGQVIATHSQGVDGSRQEWDLGDQGLLTSLGQGIATTISEIVLAETKRSEPPVDPLAHGVLMAGIAGLAPEEGLLLSKAMAKELLIADILVTEDPRQAVYVIGGLVEMAPTGPDNEMVRIIWRVGEINGKELGNAVQEKEVAKGSLDGRWGEVAEPISKAAAKGIARIMADFSRSPMVQKPVGGPPQITLPKIPGRALPPPP